jgi:hypothetical protein
MRVEAGAESVVGKVERSAVRRVVECIVTGSK